MNFGCCGYYVMVESAKGLLYRADLFGFGY